MLTNYETDIIIIIGTRKMPRCITAGDLVIAFLQSILLTENVRGHHYFLRKLRMEVNFS